VGQFETVIRYMEIDLPFGLLTLSQRTLLIIFLGHGFVENSGFALTDKYETPRYVRAKAPPSWLSYTGLDEKPMPRHQIQFRRNPSLFQPSYGHMYVDG
jgi:hypothetical protein